jgi:hypothetical protein
MISTTEGFQQQRSKARLLKMIRFKVIVDNPSSVQSLRPQANDLKRY